MTPGFSDVRAVNFDLGFWRVPPSDFPMAQHYLLDNMSHAIHGSGIYHVMPMWSLLCGENN